MRVIIIGCNRAEIIQIKVANQNKHFLESRGQLYKVAPDALTRMRIIKDGKEEDSEEVVIYRENSITPYHSHGVPHDQERILAEIDEHKLLGPDPSPLGRSMAWIKEARSTWGALVPILPAALAVIILAWALLTGGHRWRPTATRSRRRSERMSSNRRPLRTWRRSWPTRRPGTSKRRRRAPG